MFEVIRLVQVRDNGGNLNKVGGGGDRKKQVWLRDIQEMKSSRDQLRGSDREIKDG